MGGVLVGCRSECCPGCEKPSQPTVPRGSRSSPTAQGSKPPKPLAVRGSSRPGLELDLPMTYRPPSRGSSLMDVEVFLLGVLAAHHQDRTVGAVLHALGCQRSGHVIRRDGHDGAEGDTREAEGFAEHQARVAD